MSSAETQEDAQKKANVMLKLMKGNGWRTRVWENLGWHYDVHNYALTVSISDIKKDDEKTYWCGLASDEDKAGGTPVFWHDEEHQTFKDPNEAVKRQLMLAREFVDKVEKVVKNAEAVAEIPMLNPVRLLDPRLVRCPECANPMTYSDQNQDATCRVCVSRWVVGRGSAWIEVREEAIHYPDRATLFCRR